MRPDGAPSAEWTDASDIGARCVTALEGNPVPVQMWLEGDPVPVQMWLEGDPVPVQMWPG
jgi:hypothetical protein